MGTALIPFDKDNEYWDPDPLNRLEHIHEVEWKANQWLLDKGVVTLENIYRMLGAKPSDTADRYGFQASARSDSGSNNIIFQVLNVGNIEDPENDNVFVVKVLNLRKLS